VPRRRILFQIGQSRYFNGSRPPDSKRIRPRPSLFKESELTKACLRCEIVSRLSRFRQRYTSFKKRIAFAKGDPRKVLTCIQEGRAKLAAVSETGKETGQPTCHAKSIEVATRQPASDDPAGQTLSKSEAAFSWTEGICRAGTRFKVGSSFNHQSREMHLIDCGQSVYAIHHDGPARRSKVKGRISGAKCKHELAISLMRRNVVAYVRATCEIGLTLHDCFESRCEPCGQHHSDRLSCVCIERSVEMLRGEVQIDVPTRVQVDMPAEPRKINDAGLRSGIHIPGRVQQGDARVGG
jgi:hypothetical protein